MNGFRSLFSTRRRRCFFPKPTPIARSFTLVRFPLLFLRVELNAGSICYTSLPRYYAWGYFDAVCDIFGLITFTSTVVRLGINIEIELIQISRYGTNDDTSFRFVSNVMLCILENNNDVYILPIRYAIWPCVYNHMTYW